MSRYEVLSHTADTGITTTGDSLGAVIANAAYAMFDLMHDLGPAADGSSTRMEFEPAEPPELLVSVLSELLYRSEAADVAFTDIVVETDDGDRVVVTALAHAVEGLERVGPPVKAVTYHDLRCEPTDEGWLARVIFDV
jgi:protein archease